MATILDYNRIFHAYLDDDFEVLFAPDAPPSQAAIETYSKEIACALPDDFRCVLANYCNGFYAEARECVWPVRKGGAFWMFQRGLMVYGLNGGLPDWINLRQQTSKFRSNTRSDLTPCMKTVSDPDPYCFTASGELVRWDHEIGKPKPVEGSFFSAFEAELQALQKNKERAKVELKK